MARVDYYKFAIYDPYRCGVNVTERCERQSRPM